MKKRWLQLRRNNQIHIGRGILRILLSILCFMAVISFLWEIYRAFKTKEKESGGRAQQWLENSIMEVWLPGISSLSVENNNYRYNYGYSLMEHLVMDNFPVLLYGMEQPAEYDLFASKESSYEELLLLEGADEDKKEIEGESLEYGEDAIHLDKSLEEAFLAENGMVHDNQGIEERAEEYSETGQQLPDITVFHEVEEPLFRYRWDTLQSYEELVKAFYAIDSTTKAGEELLSAEKLLNKDMRMQGSNENPQILIYHTHSQEAFADSIPNDSSTSIVGAGEKLAQVLREKYGYNVIHHTVSYDAESRDYAYSNALPGIEQVLAENPTIEVVIDLHRDAIPEDKKLVIDLQGRPTAQFMFFNGLSRTAKNGAIEYLENPYLDDNLAFSFQMQTASNEYYPGIARRIYLKAYRYNMHLRPKSLLIELGAQTNTLEEIMNAIDPLAHVLNLVFIGDVPDVD
ncbi:MAG: stage II sporulation protein P [Lachnospiraceae bacterium]|nr:stage II sporulation protein P [Lachnospiraceae bacterium]